MNKERVLLFISAKGEGYARDIARFFSTDVTPVQRQLDALERGGVLLSRVVGRTRLFTLNSRYPLTNELKVLLEKPSPSIQRTSRIGFFWLGNAQSRGKTFMKSISEMNTADLAALARSIRVVLSGGAGVAIYASDRFV